MKNNVNHDKMIYYTYMPNMPKNILKHKLYYSMLSRSNRACVPTRRIVVNRDVLRVV